MYALIFISGSIAAFVVMYARASEHRIAEGLNAACFSWLGVIIALVD